MREAEKGVEGAAFLFAPRHGEEGSFTVVLPPALIFLNLRFTDGVMVMSTVCQALFR